MPSANNLGSVSALCGFTVAQDSYTSAKGALISLTKSLTIQFARHDLRWNIIHPGIIETAMQAAYPKDAAKQRSCEEGIPLGRSRPRGRTRRRYPSGLRRLVLRDRRRDLRRRRLHRAMSRMTSSIGQPTYFSPRG